MKIKSFEYIKRDKPNMGSGTGYSEADHFHVVCDNGFETNVAIDIWYMTESLATLTFKEVMKLTFGNELENLLEAFEMYKKALQGDHCPWYWCEDEK